MLSAVFSNDINLAHNTHLRSLHLKVFHRDVNPLTWVTTLLAQITSPYLVHMTLVFQVEDVSLLNTIDWTGLENVFNQQRWSNRQELRPLRARSAIVVSTGNLLNLEIFFDDRLLAV
jgi:hypothetical protein